MAEAVFGLIGVVVGGVLSGGVTWVMARRQERSNERVAARLVALELHEIRDLLRLWLKIRELRYDWWARPEAWLEHREVLARGLSSKNWMTVRHAYDRLNETEKGIADIKTWTDPESRRLRCRLEVGDEGRTLMEEEVELVTYAINALEATAGDPPVPESESSA